MADDLVQRARAAADTSIEPHATHMLPPGTRHHVYDSEMRELLHALADAVAGKDDSGLSKLAAFGAWCARSFRDNLCDVDGGSAQDAMERLGVLERRVVSESCGEGCVCADYGGFPQDCYVFPTDVQVELAKEALRGR